MKNGPYILVLAPLDYPGTKYRKRYVYEHQLVWWQKTGQLVPVGFVIHHKNENKHDNSFENLELKSKAVHGAEHGRARKSAPIDLVCDGCGKNFGYAARNYRVKRRAGQATFSCSRSCGVKAGHRSRTLSV